MNSHRRAARIRWQNDAERRVLVLKPEVAARTEFGHGLATCPICGTGRARYWSPLDIQMSRLAPSGWRRVCGVCMTTQADALEELAREAREK